MEMGEIHRNMCKCRMQGCFAVLRPFLLWYSFILAELCAIIAYANRFFFSFQVEYFEKEFFARNYKRNLDIRSNSRI